ncbi:MAG: hypothetical protein GY702_24300 [Desulfobulbaceae bacterium]|nr:hypothetical protein [Desulfobulbaceae bacterium]
MFSLSAYLFQVKLNNIPKSITIDPVSKQVNTDEAKFVTHYCKPVKDIKINDNQQFVEIPCLPTAHDIEKRYFTSGEISVKYHARKALEEKARIATAKKVELKTQLDKFLEELDTIEADTNSKRKKELEEQIKYNEGDARQAEISLENFRIISSTGLYGYDMAHIFTEIDHFETFFKPISDILKFISFDLIAVDNYWSFPQPILKIHLVFSMGILGSLIFLTIEFINEPKFHLEESFSMYFFRASLGMIIALAIYVMIKSGQSVIPNNEERDLSPYFISFVGIISGMLADKAYQYLTKTGLGLLKTSEDNSENKVK